MKKVLSTILILTLIISMGISQLVNAETKALLDIKGNWAETYIQELFSKGIIAGNDKGYYEPAKSITKAEFTTLLVKVMGLDLVDGNSFTDINYDKYWARPYIETAVANNIIIVNEEGNEYFGNIPLKRVDMAMMMVRALKLNPSVNLNNPFYDVSVPDGYITKLYEEYLLRGITEGGKLLFKGNSLSTKAECATVISRVLDYTADPIAFVANSKAVEEAKETIKDEAAAAEAELIRKADAAGVSVDLFKNPTNLDGMTLLELHNEAITALSTYVPGRETKGTTEADLDYVVHLANEFISADWNIDYKTVQSTYLGKVENLVPYSWLQDGYIQSIIDNYIKNKAVQDAQYNTSKDLVYLRDGSWYVRGTVKFRWNEPTSDTLLNSIKERDKGNLLVLGKWYEEDLEIKVAGSYFPTDKLVKLRVYSVKSISSVRAIDR